MPENSEQPVPPIILVGEDLLRESPEPLGNSPEANVAAEPTGRLGSLPDADVRSVPGFVSDTGNNKRKRESEDQGQARNLREKLVDKSPEEQAKILKEHYHGEITPRKSTIIGSKDTPGARKLLEKLGSKDNKDKVSAHIRPDWSAVVVENPNREITVDLKKHFDDEQIRQLENYVGEDCLLRARPDTDGRWVVHPPDAEKSEQRKNPLMISDACTSKKFEEFREKLEFKTKEVPDTLVEYLSRYHINGIPWTATLQLGLDADEALTLKFFAEREINNDRELYIAGQRADSTIKERIREGARSEYALRDLPSETRSHVGPTSRKNGSPYVLQETLGDSGTQCIQYPANLIPPPFQNSEEDIVIVHDGQKVKKITAELGEEEQQQQPQSVRRILQKKNQDAADANVRTILDRSGRTR